MGQAINHAEIEDTALPLKVLARTRELLDGGKRWRANKPASLWLGFACDPLSPRAHYFSLVGAAMRAHWELCGEAAGDDEAEIRTVHIVRAMSSFPATPYTGEVGWREVESILTGLEAALKEYGRASWSGSKSALRA